MAETAMRIDPDKGMERALAQTAELVARHAAGRGFDPDAPLDVAAIRRATGLSQAAFAKRFGLKVGSLRNWEQGRRSPDGAARTLLHAVARAYGDVADGPSPIVRDPETGEARTLMEALAPHLGEKAARDVSRKVKASLAAQAGE